MKYVVIGIACVLSVGCALNEGALKKTLQENPKIVFDVIEENPEQFLEVVNRTAKKAQQKQYEEQLARMKSSQEQDLKSPKKPKIDPARILYGSEKARITIVEYADFQCPACSMAHANLKVFKEKYKDELQFVFKNMPLDFHEMAEPASKYLEAIRLQDRDKAMKFHDYVFENQKKLNGEEFLKTAAAKVGADLKRLAKDLNSEKVKSVILEDMQEFQSFGFDGTPVIILNGVALRGAPSLEALEDVLKKTQK